MQHHKLCNSKSSMVIAGLTLLIAIMQMCLTQNQKKRKKNPKAKKITMTHLGVEFVRTSFLTCLCPNEPKKEEERKQDGPITFH